MYFGYLKCRHINFGYLKKIPYIKNNYSGYQKNNFDIRNKCLFLISEIVIVVIQNNYFGCLNNTHVYFNIQIVLLYI